MKPKIILSRFIYFILSSHIAVYLCWSFVEMSFLIPIIQTFETSSSRGAYLGFLFCVISLCAPFYIDFVKDSKNNL